MNLTLSNLIPLVSILISSGLIGYLVRLVIKIEVLKTLFDEQQADTAKLQDDIHLLDKRTSSLEDALKAVREHLITVEKNTSDIPKILEKTTVIERAIGTFVPEKQINMMEEATNRRLSSIESDLKMTRSELALSKRPTPEF